jgi:hypothetical protein
LTYLLPNCVPLFPYLVVNDCFSFFHFCFVNTWHTLPTK